MKLDSDRIYDKLVTAGDDWSEKDYAANLLEETKKSVLSQIKTRMQEKSDAARETLALAHPDYMEHLKVMCAARREANKARVRYDSAKILSELRRSEESSRRAEMTMR